MTDSSRTTASRNSRPNAIPMPASRGSLTLARRFSQAEYEKLARGVVPRNMDDKWFIFLEDDWLYFHRASFGFCIYQVKLDRVNDEYSVTAALVNRDESQYSVVDNDYDKEFLSWLIDSLLLRKQRTPPTHRQAV